MENRKGSGTVQAESGCPGLDLTATGNELELVAYDLGGVISLVRAVRYALGEDIDHFGDGLGLIERQLDHQYFKLEEIVERLQEAGKEA